MKIGDKFIDLDGNIATIYNMEPFSFIVDYGFTCLELRSEDTFARFFPMTELVKALL